MADSKNILNVLVETQNKSVENLMETSKKMRESFGQPDAVEKVMQMMRDWYAKQETITKEMTESVKGQMITDKTPDFVKQWVETQEKFSAQWANAYKEITSNYGGEKMLDTYKENADKLFIAWKKYYDQFTGMFATSFGMENYDPSTQAKEMHDRFVENARQYIQMIESSQKK